MLEGSLFDVDRLEEPRDNNIVMLIDLGRCIGCFACETACKLEHELPMGPRLIRVMQVGPKTVYRKERVKVKENGKLVEKEKVMPRIRTLYIPMLCMHCTPAPCVEACPTGAMKKRTKDGIVYIEEEACLGCKQCMQACPFGAPQFDSRTGKVIKCDFCMHRVDYKRVFEKADLEKIYRYIYEKGGQVYSVAYDELGDIKRNEKGRLVDENGEVLQGDLLLKRKPVEKIEINGLWSACATKCTTDAMKFGYYKDLKPYIEKLKEKREIKRLGSVFYAIPKG